MKVVITGGSGKIGKYLIDELLRNNHTVTNFDIKAVNYKNVKFVKGNILNIEECLNVFREQDAVIHLAAIPNPLLDSEEKIFNYNAGGTFIVYKAALDAGIKKIILASSDSSYGFNFRKKEDILIPEYLPIDENHPQKPADPYGLSKKFSEEIAKYFAVCHNLSTVVMRITGVIFPSDSGYVVYPGKKAISFETLYKKGEIYWYADVRDIALAFRQALEAKELKKFEAFCISAADNGSNISSQKLSEKFWKKNIFFLKEVKNNESLYNWSKAKLILGYEPKHSFIR